MQARINERIHRNVTFKRLALDFYQYVRSQRATVRCLGRHYRRSRRYIEIDITYRCNLKCASCNRSCTQAPSSAEMSVAQMAAFVDDCIANRVSWERIRLLGGEPTLHSELAAMVAMLLDYKANHNPGVRIVICTNGHGRRVKRALARLPAGVQIKSTYKNGTQRLFRPFNLAPIDNRWYKFADYSSGCRILSDCGIGLTPFGYYPCAIAGGIDRIFGYKLGRKHLPNDRDNLQDLLQIFCRLCGHFGFGWPTKRARMSSTWKRAYRQAQLK